MRSHYALDTKIWGFSDEQNKRNICQSGSYILASETENTKCENKTKSDDDNGKGSERWRDVLETEQEHPR